MSWTRHHRREKSVDGELDREPAPAAPPTPPTAPAAPAAAPITGPSGASTARRGVPTGSPAFVARLKAVLDG